MTLPGSTYGLVEVAAAVSRSTRTLRSWIAGGLLPAPSGRGLAARYDEAFLLRARAIDALLRGSTSLSQVRKRLAKATPEEVARIVTPVREDPVGLGKVAAPTYVAAAWDRIVLWEGLEVHVRGDRPVLRRIAQQIVDAFGEGNGVSARSTGL